MYSHLEPYPPLQLLDLGLCGPGLLYIKEGMTLSGESVVYLIWLLLFPGVQGYQVIC